jgi:hypothetical protein
MKYLAILFLSVMMSLAHAEYVDLQGGDVVRQAMCTQGKKKMLCVAIQKDDKLYVVTLDEKGEHSIYWISPKGNVLLWSRSTI